jgi:SAM-dependent methyltransferase
MTLRRALLRRRKGGRVPSLGQDYQRGHLEYVARMGPAGERWLQTKPFSAPPSRELVHCLRVFAHIVERLGLGLRAQVLDVGCGPGWLSEYLARCGYWVTGIDVSEDMVRIARERVGKIENPIGEGVEALAEFHVMDVSELPWSSRFDVAVLHDTMHHFDEELETLRVIRRTLVPGGRIFIEEGVRPPPGSEAERNLIEEMRRFGTLESPFDPAYLVEVLENAGFVGISRFAEVDELLDLSRPDQARKLVDERLRQPETNTIIAVNPIPAGPDGGGTWRADIAAVGPWTISPDGREFLLPVHVTNVGHSFWPIGPSFPYPQGAVTVAPYATGPTGERIELPRAPLPFAVSPGGVVGVHVRIPRDAVSGVDEITIDLVREGIAWFAELGSTPLAVPLDPQ